MPEISLLPTSGSPAPGLFIRLTRLELLVLSAKVGKGRRRARLAALRARSLSQFQGLLRLGSQLAELERDIREELSRR